MEGENNSAPSTASSDEEGERRRPYIKSTSRPNDNSELAEQDHEEDEDKLSVYASDDDDPLGDIDNLKSIKVRIDAVSDKRKDRVINDISVQKEVNGGQENSETEVCDKNLHSNVESPNGNAGDTKGNDDSISKPKKTPEPSFNKDSESPSYDPKADEANEEESVRDPKASDSLMNEPFNTPPRSLLDDDDAEPGPSGLSRRRKWSNSSADSIVEVPAPKKPTPVKIDLITDSEEEEIQSDKGKGKSRKWTRWSPEDKIKSSLREKGNLFNDSDKDDVEQREERNKAIDRTCSICLSKFENLSFLDECFHSFCYTCILQWSELSRLCPLCKTHYKSLIHNVKKNLDYDQFVFPEDDTDPSKTPERIVRHGREAWVFSENMEDGRRFRYRSTATHDEAWLRRQEQRRQQRERSESRNREQRRMNRRLKWSATKDRRKQVYHTHMTVKEVKQRGKPKTRDISADFFKENPALTHRLVPWLLRDLNVLLGDDDENIRFVLHFILSIISKVTLGSGEFREQLQSFFFDKTNHFVDELVSFAKSPYDIKGYDDNVVYNPPTSTIDTEPVSLVENDPARDRLLHEVFIAEEESTERPALTSSLHLSPRSAQSIRSDNDSDGIIEVTQERRQRQVKPKSKSRHQFRHVQQNDDGNLVVVRSDLETLTREGLVQDEGSNREDNQASRNDPEEPLVTKTVDSNVDPGLVERVFGTARQQDDYYNKLSQAFFSSSRKEIRNRGADSVTSRSTRSLSRDLEDEPRIPSLRGYARVAEKSNSNTPSVANSPRRDESEERSSVSKNHRRAERLTSPRNSDRRDDSRRHIRRRSQTRFEVGGMRADQEEHYGERVGLRERVGPRTRTLGEESYSEEEETSSGRFVRRIQHQTRPERDEHYSERRDSRYRRDDRFGREGGNRRGFGNRRQGYQERWDDRRDGRRDTRDVRMDRENRNHREVHSREYQRVDRGRYRRGQMSYRRDVNDRRNTYEDSRTRYEASDRQREYRRGRSRSPSWERKQTSRKCVRENNPDRELYQETGRSRRRSQMSASGQEHSDRSDSDSSSSSGSDDNHTSSDSGDDSSSDSDAASQGKVSRLTGKKRHVPKRRPLPDLSPKEQHVHEEMLTPQKLQEYLSRCQVDASKLKSDKKSKAQIVYELLLIEKELAKRKEKQDMEEQEKEREAASLRARTITHASPDSTVRNEDVESGDKRRARKDSDHHSGKSYKELVQELQSIEGRLNVCRSSLARTVSGSEP